MKKEIEETIQQYYGGEVPEIQEITRLAWEETLDIITLRWREVKGRKVVTVKSLPAEHGRIITKLV